MAKPPIKESRNLLDRIRTIKDQKTLETEPEILLNEEEG